MQIYKNKLIIVNGELYSFGGLDKSNTAITAIYKFDIKENVFVLISQLDVAMKELVAIHIPKNLAEIYCRTRFQ